jgi:hypothetical protein
MKNKFLQISIGITLLFFGAGFFVRSIHSANALPPSPKEFIEEGTNKIGKYQITLISAGSGDKVKSIIIDTETGQTVYYLLENEYNEWEKSEHQLPAKPMGN